ncbi:UNVERIFIED_CONTAM: hypothetical protein Sangu_0101300 [Sesamum angustifolium]|uniref:Uncharacterized protein n=1 Tax=Sesamum angustifolium TaxID=2727405 RepID=A0AAW2RJ74_9LAMI
MSSSQPRLGPNSDANFNENQWVIHIRRALEEELEEEPETSLSIFTVPKPLVAIRPDSFIPQQVSIGPYHYTRPEIHEMERYKLAAARRNQKDYKNLKLQALVDLLVGFERRIRACYNKYLNYNGETLAWMMAVDASFLFEFLQVCAVKQGKETATINVGSSRLSYLVRLAGNKAAHNAILRDISMLENQIPLFVLRKLLELQFSSSEKGEETLSCMLIGLCEELSPFKVVEDLPNIRDLAHLLDVLYHFCVPKLEGYSYMTAGSVQDVVQLEEEDRGADEHQATSDDDHDEKEHKERNENESTQNSIIHKPPLLEEIKIPSVTELIEAGVRFEATEGGISTITFDNKNVVIYLPTISLDINSEVVLRNLVAYEACNVSGPLVLARYVELMNGIIDTEEDAKFLRERGIIKNRLKSDEEVANLWNGMSKSIRLTKVPFLDKVIEAVNKYHSGMWKVKFENCMKKYVFGSWRFLTFLAALLMLLLMALQAFCSVYNCARVVPIKNLG